MPHGEYLKLGRTKAQRQSSYRALFRRHINERTLEDIRESTNKAWVLGSRYFKERIAKQLNRAASPALKGGDRKSAKYQKTRNIN